ncbi:SH3 domain-containing protein [Mucilaginibacter gracilis]|uniref:SH3 domain-containing protein n=2 Tax=Mucilaginibacter gracilis TaxID=423350 RepID=A0A495J968_9SPHI|nr:SH3 domain-containing protein [Mucilaginibacter gracilis]
MKRITYLLLLLALPLISLANSETDALFAKANNQYSKAKYKDAVQTYQSILSNGYQSAAVYFNLGNAYYKLGDIPSALLYYEKAHKLNPGDDDINFNIQLTTLKTTDKIDAAPDLFLTKWWQAFVLCCSVTTLGWLSVLFFIAGFGVLIVYLFAATVSLKRGTFYTSMALLFLGLLSILMAANQVHYFTSHQQAIVFSNSVTVKSEPEKAAKTLFVIHEGTKVDVLENTNGWLRVKLLNGNDGWILPADVKEI